MEGIAGSYPHKLAVSGEKDLTLYNDIKNDLISCILTLNTCDGVAQESTILNLEGDGKGGGGRGRLFRGGT